MMPTNILVRESDDEEEEEATGNELDVAAEYMKKLLTNKRRRIARDIFLK